MDRFFPVDYTVNCNYERSSKKNCKKYKRIPMNVENQALKEQNAPKKSQLIFENSWLKATRDLIQVDNQELERISIIHPGAVVMLPIDQKGNILLVRQYRYPVQQILLELPAGRLDDPNNIEQEAQRELQEETGFKAGTMTPMGEMLTAPGFTTERLYFFLATDLIPSNLASDPGEVIDVVKYSLEKVLQMIQTGEIIDMKTVAAVLKYKEKN